MVALPVLCATPMSHYCVGAERAPALQGIRHRTVPAPDHGQRELLEATRQDHVPALVRPGGRVVVSSELGRCLESQRPEPTLFPGDPRGLAETGDG